MELHFLIPAVSFLLVTLIVAATGILGTTVNGAQPGKRQWVILLPGLIAALLAWLGERFVETIVTGSGQSIHFLLKGSTATDQNVVPWVGVVYFISMVTGMFAHTTWDAINKRKAGKDPVFDRWVYLRPALVAPIVFIAVLKLVGGSSFDFAALLLSFQNGFFWQTVLSKS
jgi:hypothetical protein